MIYEIPIDSKNQTFNIRLGGIKYRMVIRWNAEKDGGWFLDIYTVDKSALITGLPLVTGANLLEQYKHVIPGALFLLSPATLLPPGKNTLGNDIKLYYSDAKPE